MVGHSHVQCIFVIDVGRRSRLSVLMLKFIVEVTTGAQILMTVCMLSKQFLFPTTDRDNDTYKFIKTYCIDKAQKPDMRERANPTEHTSCEHNKLEWSL